MSIAFQALVLLILALPGIIFLRCHAPVPQFREKTAIVDEFISGLLITGFLHAFFAAMVNWLISYRGIQIDFDSVLMLSIGQFGANNSRFNQALNAVTHYPTLIFWYFALIYLLAGISGRTCRVWSERVEASKRRKPKGDKRSRPLGIHENLGWFLTSFIEDGPNVRRWREWTEQCVNPSEYEAVRLFSVVVTHGSVPYLYFGRLEDDGIVFDESGNPSRFKMIEAHRRRLDDEDGPFVSIEGDHLIIQLEEIKTLNFWFYGIETGGITEDSVFKRIESQSPSKNQNEVLPIKNDDRQTTPTSRNKSRSRKPK